MRHDQKPPKSAMVCSSCRQGQCQHCIDILRAVYSNEDICTCRRSTHAGEPRSQQILDPTTGTVHAPGLTVDKDGKVAIDRSEGSVYSEFKRMFERNRDDGSV